MSMITIAHNGISAKVCLRIWGDVRSRTPRIFPDGFGWPSNSIEYLREPGAQPFLTAPERATERLRFEQTVASWVSGILRDMDDKTRIIAHLYFVTGKCWSEIANQMSDTEPTTVDEVELAYRRITQRIRRGLDSLTAPVLKLA